MVYISLTSTRSRPRHRKYADERRFVESDCAAANISCSGANVKSIACEIGALVCLAVLKSEMWQQLLELDTLGHAHAGDDHHHHARPEATALSPATTVPPAQFPLKTEGVAVPLGPTGKAPKQSEHKHEHKHKSPQSPADLSRLFLMTGVERVPAWEITYPSWKTSVHVQIHPEELPAHYGVKAQAIRLLGSPSRNLIGSVDNEQVFRCVRLAHCEMMRQKFVKYLQARFAEPPKYFWPFLVERRTVLAIPKVSGVTVLMGCRPYQSVLEPHPELRKIQNAFEATSDAFAHFVYVVCFSAVCVCASLLLLVRSPTSAS